jgi:DNA-binding NtrC family response regulator
MIVAVSRAHAFAPASSPIILHGESGTGKTFFAEYIHDLSGRAGGFHAFSVGMVAPQLALDELFGHVQGAYTDARRMRTGRIAAAGSGTFLLDDLHTLDLGVQKQLLQVLDRGTYSPVGSDRVQSVGCRVILAMVDDPDTLMRKGVLLKDLRYRFGACAIAVPPLRERRREIPLLVERALQRCPATTGLDGPILATANVVGSYWPWLLLRLWMLGFCFYGGALAKRARGARRIWQGVFAGVAIPFAFVWGIEVEAWLVIDWASACVIALSTIFLRSEPETP